MGRGYDPKMSLQSRTPLKSNLIVYFLTGMVLVDGHEDGKGKAGSLDDGGGTPRACRCVCYTLGVATHSPTFDIQYIVGYIIENIDEVIMRAFMTIIDNHLT